MQETQANTSNKILITGVAGFIGFHLAKRLLARGDQVIGIDNLNDYYEVTLKQARLAQLTGQQGFDFIDGSIADRPLMKQVFADQGADKVVNLAAQPGVRYSLINPESYVDTNLVGFANILEGCRHNDIKHLVFASSSSVYGANTHMPFSVHDNVDHPVSLYAASKKASELMAHSYAHLYGIPVTGLRFFTVYGPWGRPDMAPMLFARAILDNKPIKVFNHGNMSRDFTYIDDIVEGVIRVLDKTAQPNPQWSSDAPDPSTSYAPYRIYNIGNNSSIRLMDFIETLEKMLEKRAKKDFLPMQPGDVQATFADVSDLINDVGFKPKTSIDYGVKQFVDWYLDYYS